MYQNAHIYVDVQKEWRGTYEVLIATGLSKPGGRIPRNPEIFPANVKSHKSKWLTLASVIKYSKPVTIDVRSNAYKPTTTRFR